MTETESVPKRKIRWLEHDEETIDRIVRFPKTLYDKLTEEAKRRELSGATIVREALKSYLEEKPSNPDATAKIQKLLEDCTKDEGEGFEIDYKEGFLEQAKERNLTGDVWTEKHFDMVAPKLAIGYQGYFITPNMEDFMEACAEYMGLNERQKAYLQRKIEEHLETEEAKEEE